MQPESLSAWVPIFRDIIIVLLASFLLVYGATRITNPTVLGIVLGAGLTLLGAPAAIRVDQSRRRANEKISGDDDRWSHLP